MGVGKITHETKKNCIFFKNIDRERASHNYICCMYGRGPWNTLYSIICFVFTRHRNLNITCISYILNHVMNKRLKCIFLYRLEPQHQKSKQDNTFTDQCHCLCHTLVIYFYCVFFHLSITNTTKSPTHILCCKSESKHIYTMVWREKNVDRTGLWTETTREMEWGKMDTNKIRNGQDEPAKVIFMSCKLSDTYSSEMWLNWLEIHAWCTLILILILIPLLLLELSLLPQHCHQIGNSNCKHKHLHRPPSPCPTPCLS